MGLTKEYRIVMPLSVEEYRIGQLYMIARHSHEQSYGGEGIEVIKNEECFDPIHGKGQHTEKRIHLSSRLPTWIQAILPKVFYITEKAWNYYPYTITEYTISFLPRFNIHIETRYEDNNGSNENCLQLSEEQLAQRVVEYIDIAYDNIDPRYYKEDEDPCYFKSEKTGRGPLIEGWRDIYRPLMCSYKLVTTSFEVWGLQTRVEEFVHSCIQSTLLVGHRQAFTWIDEWWNMTLEDVREYENQMHVKTNAKLQNCYEENIAMAGDATCANENETPTKEGETDPNSPKTPVANKSWFSWS